MVVGQKKLPKKKRLVKGKIDPTSTCAPGWGVLFDAKPSPATAPHRHHCHADSSGMRTVEPAYGYGSKPTKEVDLRGMKTTTLWCCLFYIESNIGCLFTFYSFGLPKPFLCIEVTSPVDQEEVQAGLRLHPKTSMRTREHQLHLQLTDRTDKAVISFEKKH